jgi:nicotinamidase-related amidase
MMGKAALLIIDMLNDLAFDGGEKIAPDALKIAGRLKSLREEARAAGLPVIYVNDNYEHWRAGRDELIAYVTRDDAPGREVAAAMRPGDDDYLIIKPRVSGFYATNLPVLLPQLGVTRLILTGIAVDMCVLFTAADAHMREYGLWVPADLVTGEHPERAEWALDIMRKSMSAETRPTDELALADWLAADDGKQPGQG